MEMRISWRALIVVPALVLWVVPLQAQVVQEAVDLAVHLQNDTLRGNSPSVSPAGDLILFAAGRGLRGKELCVTFRRADGSWTDRIPLGDEVNAGRLNDSPRLTPAGNFIFFISAGNGRPWAIYWVSATILDTLRQQHLGTGPPTAAALAQRGSTPKIDGVFARGEWEDATTVALGATKRILIKHDRENLYLALDAVGGDLYFSPGDTVHQLHASFGLRSKEYTNTEGSRWSFAGKSEIELHGLQSRPADEIDAEIARHLETHGWVASLIPMGNPYEIEFAVSFAWLGVEDPGTGPVSLPRVATKHMAGPPNMRPTWPPHVTLDPALERGQDLETVEFDVADWGQITVEF